MRTWAGTGVGEGSQHQDWKGRQGNLINLSQVSGSQPGVGEGFQVGRQGSWEMEKGACLPHLPLPRLGGQRVPRKRERAGFWETGPGG